MKKVYLGLLLVGLVVFNPCKAQYVNIPDAGFVTWLQGHGFAACLNGNQLDTTCSAVLTTTTINCNGAPIYDLTGVQYFKNLATLACSGDSLYTTFQLPASLVSFNFANNQMSIMPALPTGLKSLVCTNNFISSVSALPPNLQQFSCGQNGFYSLPALPSTLQSLICDFNYLNGLPALPNSLQNLSCTYNVLYALPALPAGLQTLTCFGDSLFTLPALPSALTDLNCSSNALTSMPTLPSGLVTLFCSNNGIDSIPALPGTLQKLYCQQNHLTVMPALPAGLTYLNCGINSISSMPALPQSLQTLLCNFNLLTALPILHGQLQLLNCGYNRLTNLPALPLSLQSLYCNDNQLGALPDLPGHLTYLDCGFNMQLSLIPVLPDSMNTFITMYDTSLHCLPVLKRIVNLNFTHTAVKCIIDSGVVTNSSPAIDTFTLCSNYNPDSCGLPPVTTGVLKTDPSLFSVYPNPAKDFATISVGDNFVSGWLEVNDAIGRSILSQQIIASKFRIKTNTWANGLYLIKVMSSDNNTIIKRLVVE